MITPGAFEVIRKATPDLKNLYIYTEPRVERLVTSEGPVQIIAVPGFDKARLLPLLPRRRQGDGGTGTPPPLSTTSSWGWLRSWTGASPPFSRLTTR